MHGYGNRLPQKDTFLRMMHTMMVKMEDQNGASVEEAFIRQMIPHHEGAIEIAKYEVQFGKNVEMVQLAKSILAEQRVEV